MKTDNIIQQKSFAFAIRVINAYKYLKKEKQETTLSKQLLRSGTSIGANVEEAIGAQSKADFTHKLSISYKETRETLYWLKLLYATNYLNKEMSESLILDAEELAKIIGKIQLTTKAQ
jgi:four helix bundle protein